MTESKQEYTTLLSAGMIVEKTDPRIDFRGHLDSLAALIVRVQVEAELQGQHALIEELEEVRTKVYEIFSCEATGKPCKELLLWGLEAEEIRVRSHHPDQYYGIGHIRPHYTMGASAAGLNELRTKIRETELSACRAFATPEGESSRPDIVKVLNRLSSALYILTYQYLPKGYDKTVRF